MATNRPRYTVSVTTEMFEAIEDFRFKNRFQTRSDATTELIRLGLEVIKAQEKTSETPPDTHYAQVAAYGGNGVERVALAEEEYRQAEEAKKKIIFEDKSGI